MKLVIYGSRTGDGTSKNRPCGQTRALDRLMASAEFTAWKSANGVTVIDCDKFGNPSNYATYRAKVGYKGGNWPQIFVCDNALKVQGSFVARGFKVKALTAKIASLCADCTEATPTPRKTCPTCKGLGTVAGALLGILTLFGAGCVSTFGKFSPATADQPQAKATIYRFALLYPFEVADVSVAPNGTFTMGKYSTSGGATELVPLVTATGETVGVMLGKATKAAVVP